MHGFDIDQDYMIKDLIISEDWSPKVGGAHYWLENTYQRWPNPVTVFTATKLARGVTELPDSDIKNYPEDNLTIKRTLNPVLTISLSPKGWRSIFLNVLQVRRLLSDDSNRIHCKAYFPEGLVGAIAKRFNKKVSKLIVYAHGEEINVANSSGLLRRIAQWVYGMADIVIANSRNTERLVRSLVPDAGTPVLHPGVDVSRGQYACERRSDAGGKSKWNDDTFVVLTIARLEPRKNVIRVINALHMLQRRERNIHYVVVGSGETLPAIRSRIEEIDAWDWITLIERVTEYDKYELLAAADLFVMASVRHELMIEGFGIVFLEAAAAGLPAISGKDGGQCEAVLDDVTGFNVDGNSTEEIRAAIVKVLLDKGKASRLRLSSLEWAEKNDWPEIVSKTIRSM